MKRLTPKSVIVVLLTLAFYAYIAHSNALDKDTLVASGDLYQVADTGFITKKLISTWLQNSGQGQYNTMLPALPYYALVYLASAVLHVSYSGITQLHIFFFLTLSNLSLYLFIYLLRELLFPKDRPSFIWSWLASALYAINIYVFYFYQQGYGFTHFFLIYLFIPVLVALLIRVVISGSRKDWIWFTIVSLLSTVGYANLAFLYALLILYFFIVLLLILLRVVLWKKIRALFLVYLIAIVTALYIIVPFYISVGQRDIEKYTSYTSSFIKLEPAPLNHVISGYFSEYYFPARNLFTKVPAIFSHLYFLTSLLIIVWIVWLIKKSGKINQSAQRIRLVLFTALAVFTILTIRFGWPFSTLNTYIYTHIPGFSLFRSPDKIRLLYASCLGIISTIAILDFRKSKITPIILGVLILSMYPFYSKGIYRYITEQGENHTTLAVTIPPEYYELQKIVNADQSDGSIVALPNLLRGQSDWVAYPTWKYIGSDLLYQLYDRPYISTLYYPVENLPDANLTNFNQNDLMHYVQQFGASYILWHKDISDLGPRDSIIHTLITSLESDNRIVKAADTTFFTLYKISSPDIVPLITTDNTQSSTYQRINPTLYHLKLSGVRPGSTILMRQGYSKGWMIQTSTWQFNDAVPQHTPIYGFANEWTFSQSDLTNIPDSAKTKNSDGSYDLDLSISYQPQKYLYVSLAATIALTVLTVLLMRQKNNKS